MKISYLGPKGTFTEYGAHIYAKDKENYEYIPCTTIQDVLLSVHNGNTEEGIVPFENSIEGTVTSTLDTMIFDVDLFIKAELIVPISQNLMVKKGHENQNISKIFSHPQGLAQCREYIRKHFPNSTIHSVDSTSESARLVSESDENYAGIGSKFAAEIYGLSIIHSEIQDKHHNETRFIILSKNNTPNKEENLKTSIVFSTQNKPGELYRILDILSIWSINMTKIESRPMKDRLGTYIFFVDLESESQKDLNDALTMIKRKASYFKFLGSYTDKN